MPQHASAFCISLKLYFGFDGKDRSLQDMAEIMNCSRENVRQQIEKALKKLRHAYKNKEKLAIKNLLFKEFKTWTEK